MNRNDRRLDQIETSIARLKIEYDVFFNGGADVFPQKLHEQVDTEVKKMFDLPLLTYAQRFRLTSLAARLTAFNDLWQRHLKAQEEGRRRTSGAETKGLRQDRDRH